MRFLPLVVTAVVTDDVEDETFRAPSDAGCEEADCPLSFSAMLGNSRGTGVQYCNQRNTKIQESAFILLRLIQMS